MICWLSTTPLVARATLAAAVEQFRAISEAVRFISALDVETACMLVAAASACSTIDAVVVFSLPDDLESWTESLVIRVIIECRGSAHVVNISRKYMDFIG